MPIGDDGFLPITDSDREIIAKALANGQCPRVELRMECPECGYPYSEAAWSLVLEIPHAPHKKVRPNG